MINLSGSNDPGSLIDAIFAARRLGRKDLRPQLELLLDHGEPMVREEAVGLLLTKWRTHSLRDKATELLLNDPDAGVRARVAIGLAAVTSAKTRSEDAELLARLFADLTLPGNLRQACFEALSLMAGHPAVVELDDTSLRQVRELLDEIRYKSG
jgi:hypothetical protein